MQNADLDGMTQGLVNNAVAFGQSNQRCDLLFVSVSSQIEVQSNLLKTDGHILRDTERAAKIEIAFRANCRLA